MKKLLFAAACALLLSTGTQAQIVVPQPSPAATVQQVVGITNFTVTYSRPGAKGRTVMGNLVPFNGQVWRTGANSATQISFDDKIKIDGNEIPAGKYALFTIPGKDEWTIIINKDNSGSSQLDEKQDLLRFKVKPVSLPYHIETFTIGFNELTNTSAFLELSWEKTLVRFKVETDPDAKITAQIDRFAKNPLGQAGQNYYQSAQYYYESGKDLNKALEWATKAVEINPNAYWIVRLKSLIQAKLGDYAGAIATAQDSKKKAADAGNQEYVKMNEENIAAWEKLKK